MFKILKDQKASVEGLSTAYVEAMTFEKKLRSEQTEAKRSLVTLQLDCLEKKPTKVFLNARELLENVTSKIEAIQFGLAELKIKIGERLKVESKERLEQITKELELAASEERKLKRQYLDLCAEAALVREQIRGAETSYNGSVMVRLTPDPKFDFKLLNSEERAHYSAKVEQNSVGDFSRTITGRRSRLVDEQAKLERMLSADPLGNAEELLNRLCPSASEPEEAAEPPKSHPSYKSRAFERDYGNGQGPDYGDGPPLPYKGINEILRDRANS